MKFTPGKKDSQGFAKLKTFLTSTFEGLRSDNAAGRQDNERFEAEQDIAPNATLFSTNPKDLIISPEEWRILQGSNGDLVLFYVGTITYFDTYRNPYTTDFCEIYWGNDPRTWHVCPYQNTIK